MRDTPITIDEAFEMTRAPVTKSAAAPASDIKVVDPVERLAAAIEGQTAEIKSLGVKAPAPAAAPRAIPERRSDNRQRLLKELRDSTDEATRRRPDPLTTEKHRRISAAIDDSHDQDRADLRSQVATLKRQNAELERKLRRPPGPVSETGMTNSQKSATFAAYRKAVDSYIRTGQETFGGLHLRDLHQKALNTQVDPEGGFLVYPERDTGPLEKLLLQISPLRGLATVRQITSGTFKKPFGTRGSTARWSGEGVASTNTTEPGLVELSFPTHGLLAEPHATMEMLQDAAVDVEQWLAEESQDVFAEMEGSAFISGNGVSRPKGFLAYDMVADASWAMNKIGYLATGTSGAFDSTNPGDVVRKLPLQLKAAMRAEASWLMNRVTIGAVRVMKDGEGRYVWSEGDLSKDIPNTLVGHVVNEDEQMPDIAANAHAMALGNWRRGYLIVDRLGFYVLRDPYSAKPNVQFMMMKRVGGGVQNFEAIKTIKFGTS